MIEIQEAKKENLKVFNILPKIQKMLLMSIILLLILN